jgi:hypothetical protein
MELFPGTRFSQRLPEKIPLGIGIELSTIRQRNLFLNELYQGKSTIHIPRDINQWQGLEEVELAIHQLILDIAAEHEEDIDPKSYISHHFVAKVDGRAQKYLKDNPSEDPEGFKSLEKRL